MSWFNKFVNGIMIYNQMSESQKILEAHKEIDRLQTANRSLQEINYKIIDQNSKLKRIALDTRFNNWLIIIVLIISTINIWAYAPLFPSIACSLGMLFALIPVFINRNNKHKALNPIKTERQLDELNAILDKKIKEIDLL